MNDIREQQNQSHEDEYDQLTRWFNAEPLKTCQNKLKWWKDHQVDYPNLYRMAIDYLTIPGTSLLAQETTH